MSGTRKVKKPKNVEAESNIESIINSLNPIFADSLSEIFNPVDELIEDVLTTNGISIMYGDSNSGKTFLAIDMACAIACGTNWMNKRTEQGFVLYLAAESPASLIMRLQAFQKYHKISVPNFIIIQNPVDLFNNETNSSQIIKLVQHYELVLGTKCKLIIGDTLARLAQGGNENSGQDMGIVIKNIDCIRQACKTHFLLIHHSGKNSAAGARGWSGLRAAVDTEIEVTDLPDGRCAEITKQRDLSSKGERIGFKLIPVVIGISKWKKPIESCVVENANAPSQIKNKRFGEIAGAIGEYLTGFSYPIKKSQVVHHFEEKYKDSSVYRELRKLKEVGIITDYMGSVLLTSKIGTN